MYYSRREFESVTTAVYMMALQGILYCCCVLMHRNEIQVQLCSLGEERENNYNSYYNDGLTW